VPPRIAQVSVTTWCHSTSALLPTSAALPSECTLPSCLAGLSLLLGLAGGMDTLCGQAYGAQRYPMIGEVAQRCVLINAVIAVPIVLLWTQMSSILVWMGQSAEIAPLAAKYMLLSLPQLVLSIVTTAVEKFQTTQARGRT
jgi:multidrug resistance protein, MATE family